jgi:hypothetical protein
VQNETLDLATRRLRQCGDEFDLARMGMRRRVWLLVINLKIEKATLFSIVIPTPRASLHFTKENEPLAER